MRRKLLSVARTTSNFASQQRQQPKPLLHRISVIESPSSSSSPSSSICNCYHHHRPISTTIIKHATALPITATGPPPSAPLPTTPSSQYGDLVQKKRRQAEMIRQGKEIRAVEKQPSNSSKTSPLRKRFWTHVHVKETPEGYQIFLDTRPLRTPSKTVITVPLTKPFLAYALAIEWDLLESAHQALKNHNIPLTSMVSRAQDILEAEAVGDTKIRDQITATMMRYLGTDTLLCWAPERSLHDAAGNSAAEAAAVLGVQAPVGEEPAESLREMQMRHAKSIISYLNTSVWPGVEIRPVLDENSILPTKQSEVTRSIIEGWIAGLPAYELAALERATLASKSLLVGTRLLIEWSEEFMDMQKVGEEERFGIEEAALASSLEVRWQTGMWGEVEDTHDVEKEDMRRQLGSVILLVSGHR